MSGGHGLGAAYRSLWLSSGASAIGTGMTVTALPLLAATTDNSELALGTIAAAGLLPGLLFALPSGMLADRFDRRKLLLWSEICRAVVLAVATVAVVTDHIDVIGLAAVAFFIGIGETLYIGCSQALVPMVVADEHLDRANGRLQAAEDTAREFIGPPLGSAAYALASWIPFAADAITYLGSAALLAKMPSPPHEPPAERPSLKPAWDLFRRSRPLVILGIALFVLALSGAAVLALLVLIVRDSLGVSEGWYGPFVAVLALGSTSAGITAGRIRAVLSAKSSMVIAVALNAWAYLVLGLTDLWPVALVAFLVWGFSVTYGVVTSLGIRQRLIPPDLLGRTMALFRTALGAGALIGAFGGGVIAQATSATTVASYAGMVQLPVVLLLMIGLPRDTDDRDSETVELASDTHS